MATGRGLEERVARGKEEDEAGNGKRMTGEGRGEVVRKKRMQSKLE